MFRDRVRVTHPHVDGNWSHLKFPPHRSQIGHSFGHAGFRADIARHHASAVRGQYHWHTYGGNRYCHYWDHHGYRWWGFYIGSVFFWTRWYNDVFWWYDARWGRWCYYDDGYWWWYDEESPDVWYVYEDGVYYRHERTGNGTVLRPSQPTGGPVDPTEPEPGPVDQSEQSFFSDDGTRVVQIVSAEKRALLWDRTKQDAQGNDEFIAELGKNVVGAQFSDPADGPMQIVITIDEGNGQTRVATFDSEGQPLGAAPGGEQTPNAPAVVPADPEKRGSEPSRLEGTRHLIEGFTPEGLGSNLR
ncbi:MAG: hypothetical protein HY059_09585 [Proteobacteria bacterium]|nr:hypothetical protein [Pseudomonadota bacterium]